ncbi:cuticular protein RR-1 motif 10 precursor [Danaus plexippus plexippus]|uniref:Cuticular protein RR-1 motif 10 n=1 Tax=Danaus plexippus plexippus TaxID=278856 RepID=A0A212EWJ0_DANPL|nr:cuticular protein RR-1 motif 10 precursor [Danaus plexippus plexippus]
MYRLLAFAFVFALAACQQQEGARRVPKYAGDPKTAAIVQEARYLSGNGAFGAAYQQEDGIDFKEETDADGNRKGSYSYIDPTGQRKTVNYIAGKNGFQAIGDHIPTAPLPVAPTPGYQPDPRYNSPDYKSPQYSAPQQYSAPVAPRNYGGVQQAQYSGIQSQQYNSQPARQDYYDATTPPPSRFFPPGKFSLNRAPDGYTYSFHKV